MHLVNSSYTIAPKKWRQDDSECDIILYNWIKL